MLNAIELRLLCLCFVCSSCLPTGNEAERRIPADHAFKFMKQYGYLVDDHGQSEAIYSEENLSNIIKTLQRFGAIEETGIIDNNTLKLMSSPRCGVADIIPEEKSRRKKRFAVQDGWNKRNITYFISNWSPKLGEEAVAKNIQKALDVWGGYGRLTFTRSSSPSADIIVAFARGYHGDRYPFDGPGLVLAHAFFPSDYGTPDTGGDIHFDDDENWMDFATVNQDQDLSTGTDFFTVALHELGHSLGLSHSDVPTSVMFPYYKGWVRDSQNLLDYDDILGMYNLYIQRRVKGDDFTPAFSPPTVPTFRPYETTPREREETTLPSRRSTKRPRDREETTPPSRRKHHRFGHKHQHHHPTQFPRTDDDGTILYEGDDESIERHKEHDPHNKTPKNNSPSLPYICHGHFDAVAALRGQLFIFKDEYIWRLEDWGRIMPGYPVSIRQMFPELPKHIRKIDAAYQRPDGHIVLFTGRKIWIYDGSRFVDDSPLTLSYFHLPDYLDSIDAVQNWARNGKTYFYKNERFWRYDETTRTMDPGYPMSMDRWRNIPTYLDAATTWRGVTYFFKGELFWKFDNNWIQATDSSPLPIAPIWLGCKEDMVSMKQLFGV